MIDLRDYQIDLAAKGAEALGHLGVIYLSMQVRTGKTLTALDIARQYGARHVLFITKKRAIASIERDFDALRPGYAITVTNKESLHRIEGDFDLVVVDECFPPGTLVGGVPIERLKIGDQVWAYDENTGTFDFKKIERLFCSTPSQLVKLSLANGKHIVCTPTHPIFSSSGWTNAVNCLDVGFADAKTTQVSRTFPLLDLSSSNFLRLCYESTKKNLLFSVSFFKSQANFGSNKRDGSDPVDRKNAESKSNAPAWGQGEGFSQAKSDWPQATYPGGEWAYNAKATGCFIEGLRAVLGAGISCSYSFSLGTFSRAVTKSLQAGFGSLGIQNLHRARWVVSSFFREKTARYSQRCSIKFVGVDSVEILEPGSDGTFGGYCPDGKVYNIEVQGFHTYTVGDGCIVHNCHQYGAFPKPAKYARDIKLRFGRLPMILLSGTPTPESYSQIYHQFWLSARSPFLERDFYTWARAYVNISQRDYGHGRVNDYSNAYWERIAPVIEPYMVRLTQEEAGFVNVINEHFIELEATPAIKLFAARLTNDLCFCGENWAITADTPVSLQQKLHQIYSGTVLYDEVIGEPRRGWILDKSKAYWILGFGKKVVIFYCFTKEWEAIKGVLGDRVTQDLDEFNSTDKSIALQIVSGREGLNLSKAEAIVYYNIAFSAVSYWQSRDRLTTIDRRESDCYYLFTKGGIEEKIYGAVVAKKDYTNTLFRRDFGIDRSRFPGKANPAVPGRGVPRGQNNSGQYQRVT